ncbi:MAG: class I SAM-dependent methyltransferase [Tagaea sp.]
MTERKHPSLEESIRDCYRTWSGRYYADYYDSAAAYPPVHVELIRRALRAHGTRTLLDAGCGPASMLRDLRWPGLARWGFDLTPEMVDEARRILADQDVPADRIWLGSALHPSAFRAPSGAPTEGFDAAICFGVLPHIPADGDATILANLRDAVRPGGLVAVEARNSLFALFTQNRYTAEFFRRELIRPERIAADDPGVAIPVARALEALEGHFRMDLPPKRGGYEDEAGYDEVLSRTHNPFELRAIAEAAGLVDVRVFFYHYHALPPMFEAALGPAFRAASLAIEDPEDWRGHFMASAFVLAGKRQGGP